jgi:YfiH family protein
MLIEAPDLASLPGIRHAFFTRQGGVSQGIYASLNGGVGSADDPAAVAENRSRMASALGVRPNRLLSLYQIHSAEIVTVEAPWQAEERPRADGLVTRTPGIALAAASADCGPVLFADARAGVVGAAHAGWKGAFTGVLEATIARMEELGAARRDVVAVLGPTIGRDAYEVGPEFVDRFIERDARYDRFFRPSSRGGHALFDLPAFILHRLEAAGVGAAVSLGLCTYSDETRFFSYRRATHRGEPDYGRLLSAIALDE